MNAFHSLILVFVIAFSAGCTQLQLLPYLDQALLLKEFGSEKDAQTKYVKNIDAKFDQMLADIESRTFFKLETEQAIIQTYGPPILLQDDQIDAKPVKKALYRYAIQNKDPIRVYIYYDQNGQIVKWKKIG